jgi:hypothetical protein
MRYILKYQPFHEQEQVIPLEDCSEEEALRQYDATKISLSLGEGGYLQLFEKIGIDPSFYGPYPIKAERVGWERDSIEEEEEEATTSDSDGKAFPITSVTRGDLASIGLTADEVALFSDGDMQELARKMADAYCESRFWDDLGIIARMMLEQ